MRKRLELTRFLLLGKGPQQAKEVV